MLLWTAKEALAKQTTFTTYYAQKYLYSLTIMFFLTNSLDKASKLLFIFVRVCRGYTPFLTQKDRLLLVVYEACTVVFQLINACKTRREGNSQSLSNSMTNGITILFIVRLYLLF